MSAMPQTIPSAGAPVIKDWKHFARTYTAHPLAEIFPMIDPKSKDYGSLVGSIGVLGVLEPIVLTRDMRVLDGRNRLRVAIDEIHAEDTEKAPKFIFFDQLPIDHELVTERDYVASKNLSRRHLTDEQKAAAVALLFHGHTERAVEARKEKLIPGARTRRVETDTTSKPAHRTHEKVQKEAGVSQHKARQALRVVEANPELAKQVVAGEVSLKDAAKQVQIKVDETDETRRPQPAKPSAPRFTDDVFVDDAIAKCLAFFRKHVGALAGQEQRALCAEQLCLQIKKLATENA